MTYKGKFTEDHARLVSNFESAFSGKTGVGEVRKMKPKTNVISEALRDIASHDLAEFPGDRRAVLMINAADIIDDINNKNARRDEEWEPVLNVPWGNQHPYAKHGRPSQYVIFWNGHHQGIGYARADTETDPLEYWGEDEVEIDPPPICFRYLPDPPQESE